MATTATVAPLAAEELTRLDAWWRAANYLSVGQIYLLDNPLLREPLRPEHVKPRLLGHWGTTPGLNFIYAHLNRVIRAHDLNTIYIAGPGHGGPGLVASTWLEGTYSEAVPEHRPRRGRHPRAVRQFSFPGGIPSHVAPETPGSIHEGGELGYALAHAYGAVLDNPDLLVACVVGDGEAETGPLAASWHSNKFINPRRDGVRAADPAPQRLQDRQPDRPEPHPARRAEALMTGYGYRPWFVEGDEPKAMHQAMAAALDEIVAAIARDQGRRRRRAAALADAGPAQPQGLDRSAPPRPPPTRCR